MERITGRLAAAALVAVLTVGCAENSAPAGGHPSSAATASSTLPDPFTIVARYSAKSLGLNYPDALTVGPDGNMYVTDRSQRVSVISPAGKVLRRWGRRGSGPGEFRFIASDPSDPTETLGKIAVGPGGLVYVSDSGNARVQVFMRQGRFVRQFGSFGSGKGQFLLPDDVLVDEAGNVYVADDQAGTLSKFSPAGKVIWRIGTSASTDPDLAGHFHLGIIDVHGRLVIVNNERQKILYIDPSGHKVDTFSPHFPARFPIGGACEATVDAAGDTYVSGCGPGRHPGPGPTLVFDRAHRLIARWPGSEHPLRRSPCFGPHGEVFALADDGFILKLHITVPGG